MDPQDGSPTNNGRSSAPAQNSTASINGVSVQQGGYGLVGGAVPGGQSQAQAYAVRPQPGLNPQAAAFLPHQNHSVPGQQPAPQPAHFAYHSHQNGQARPVPPPAVSRPAFSGFSFIPGAQNFQAQNSFAGQEQHPRPHNNGGGIAHQGVMYGHSGVNIGYGRLQDANSFTASPNYPMLPHNNGAILQGTYYPSGVPTSGPPASAGITSSGFDASRNPYAPPAVTRETQRQNFHLQLHLGRGQIRRRGHAVGSRQKRGSRQYHREPLHVSGQSQQPSVPRPYTSQGAGGAGLPVPSIPGPDQPLSSIEQEITQPNHSAPGPTQPDDTMNSEPGQPRPSTPGASQPLAEAPSANNNLGQMNPMQDILPNVPNELGLLQLRFYDFLSGWYPTIDPEYGDAVNKLHAYWIEQLNLDGGMAQQPEAGNPGNAPTVQAVGQSLLRTPLPTPLLSPAEIYHYFAILNPWIAQDPETLRIAPWVNQLRLQGHAPIEELMG